MTTTAPPRLTVHSREDLLALAPALLGFWPRESLVMLTLGAARPFHARLDLPPPASPATTTARLVDDALLRPAVRHGARAVVLLYFTADAEAVLATHAAVRAACARAGLRVALASATDGRRHADLDGPERPGPAVPYDAAGHPFVRAAVAAGRLAHASREDLVASLGPDPAAVEAVRAALAEAGHAAAGLPAGPRAVRAQGAWVAATVARATGGADPPGAPPGPEPGAEPGPVPGPAVVARLVWTMQVPHVRDAAWSQLDRAHAAAHVRFWTAVLRGTPDELAAAPATLLGWAAWQDGDGARAWAALDRCARSDPAYPLAADLALLLRHAVPPEAWTGGFDWTLGLPRGGSH